MSSFDNHGKEKDNPRWRHPVCSLDTDVTTLTPASHLCLWCHMGFEEFQSSISVTGYWIDDAQQHINKYHSSNPAEEIVRRSWWLQFQLKQLGYELPNKEA